MIRRTYRVLEDAKDPFVDRGVFKQACCEHASACAPKPTLCALGDAGHKANKEYCERDQHLRQEGLDIRVLDVRSRMGEEASGSTDDDDHEDGDDDDGDTLQGGTREEDQPRGLTSANTQRGGSSDPGNLRQG